MVATRGREDVGHRTSDIGRFFLLLLLVSCAGAAEARLELPDPLIPGAVLEGSVVVENAAARIKAVRLPEVAGLEWKVQSGGLFQTTIINGKSSSSETVRLAMRAQVADTIRIPAITIELQDGSTVQTAAATATAQAANANLVGEAYAELSFEPPTIVPGEPTTLVYRVYLKQDRDRAIKEPDVGPPAGTISLGERSDSRGSTNDATGERWSVLTYRWPLTCSQPGPLEVRGQQQFYRCRRDFFDHLVAESSHQVAIRPATLTVTALPSEGRPDDFTGLFGPLSASASLERTRIAAGEGTALELSVEGRQIELLKRPALELPAGLQAYAKDDAPAKPGAAGATRTFRWDIVPSAAGDYTVPAFSFAYFDPATRSYRRAETRPIALTVLPGRSRDLAVTGAPLPAATSAAATAAAPARVELPVPFRGQAPSRPPGGLGWEAALAALLIGGGIGLLQRWRARAPSAAHRGRALRRAVGARDATAIAQAAQALLPAADGAKREALLRLQQAADLARFGNQPLPAEIDALARQVEDLA